MDGVKIREREEEIKGRSLRNEMSKPYIHYFHTY